LLFGQRGDQHGDASAFASVAIDLSAVLQGIFDLLEDSMSFVDMRQFAASESERELHPVTAQEESPGPFDFDHEIVRVDFRCLDANFLQFGLVPMSLLMALLLGEIVLVLTVVEDSADWWGGCWYNLNEIEPRLACHCLGFAERDYTSLFFVLIDQANW
jgi:hypothetical protein